MTQGNERTNDITAFPRTESNSPDSPDPRLEYAILGVGPIIIPKLYNGKDKTFFMFDSESRRRRQPGNIATANQPALGST